MNKKFLYYTIGGIIFTSIAGTLLHFAYEFSGYNPLAGMFTPVNESVWEHMKLVFFPAFLYCMAGWPFFYKSRPAFFRSCLSGILTGTLSVAVIFYAYSGIIGNHYLILDILTFLSSVLITFSLSYQLTVQNITVMPTPFLVFLIVALMVCFFIFTYAPPDIALFIDSSREQEKSISNFIEFHRNMHFS